MAVKSLIEGYKKFYNEYFVENKTLFEGLSSGQSPKTLVIACSDSRVSPSIVLQAEPGEIFTIRNVANLVPPYENGKTGLHGVSAALEFAVNFVGVENILVMGHSNCAGIKSLVDGIKVRDDFITPWVQIGATARGKVMSEYHNYSIEEKCIACEKESIKNSLQNLLTFPWIRDKVEAGKIEIHGWYFCVRDGSIQAYNQESNAFENIL
jgi:carbonic anhydrase